MKNLKDLMELCLYVICAIIAGKILSYIIFRGSNIFYELLNFKTILLPVFFIYLLLTLIFSVIILFGIRRIKISQTTFLIVIFLFLSVSVLFVGCIHFVDIKNFEPLEFRYVVYDVAMYGFLMGLLCLVVKKNNINGVKHWRSSDENYST
jgi:hypothetical protein